MLQNLIASKRMFLRDDLSHSIVDFFSYTLDAFGNELNQIAHEMYQYPKGKLSFSGNDSINDVFALIERSYFGILNSAVKRSFVNDSVLQEFAVYNQENKHAGRADCLIVHHFEKQKINLLFEGKTLIENGDEYSTEEMEVYYDFLYKQALKYYDAEKDYYMNETYIVTIIFEWVKEKGLLDKYLEGYTDDKCTDFYYLYHTEQSGLAVYGKLFPA